MDKLEQLLLNLVHLTHLELYATGYNDLANGNRWLILAHSLIMLNFKFEIFETLTDEILESFRTSFWLVEKRWYVAYDQGCLFTVPYFASVEVYANQLQEQIPWTTSDPKLFYKQVTKINLTGLWFFNVFHHSRTFVFEEQHNLNIIRRMFETTIDMCQIQQITLLLLIQIQLLKPYFLKMFHLYKLSVVEKIKVDSIEQIRTYRIKQIRTLEIGLSTQHTSYIIELLLRVFPNVEHLRVSSINSKMDMIRLIDGFNYLSDASFTIDSNFGNIEPRWYFEPELLMYDSRQWSKDTNTCRLNHLVGQESSITVQVWMGTQVSFSCIY
ncbi:unnamed protein product [Rotaria sp. Silwood1]|nr:unnamed protein product [Rotaria sp. Silwood1]